MPARKRKHEEISNAGVAKENGDSTDHCDLTKSMEAPLAQPHVEEVHVPKNMIIKKETTDYQPYRNGTFIDLDAENNQNNSEETKELAYLNGNHQSSGK